MLADEREIVEARADPFTEGAVGSWYLLRTRSRHEKIVANDLAARGVLHYLPLTNCIRYYGDRKAKVEIPLFPGYVFLRGAAEDAYAVDRFGRIAQILLVPNQKRVNEELRNIWFALSKDAQVSLYPYLHKGVRVEVRSGPLRGLQGVIEDWAKRNRLLLQVEILGRGVSLEIEAALLDAIE